MAKQSDIKVVATNKKAGRDYFLQDRFEAGLALLGSEIKSIRAGRVNLAEAYVKEERGEMWLVNAHIATYARRQGNEQPSMSPAQTHRGRRGSGDCLRGCQRNCSQGVNAPQRAGGAFIFRLSA